MIRLFFTSLIILLLSQSCKNTELETYEGGSSIYFSVQQDSLRYSWGIIDGNIKERILKLPIYLFGHVKDYDRKIKIRTVLCEIDSLRAEPYVDFLPIPSEVFLAANTNKTEVEITMIRTAALSKHERIVTVVIEENEEFDSEYNHQKDYDGNPIFIGHRMTIISDENFPRPWWWKDNNPYFGKWSYLKADLICRLCSISRADFTGNTVIPDFKLKYYGKKVQRWLNEQNPSYKEEDGSEMTMGEKSQE